MCSDHFDSLIVQAYKSLIDEIAKNKTTNPDIGAGESTEKSAELSAIHVIEAEVYEFLEIRPILMEAAYASQGIPYPGDDNADISKATQIVVQKALKFVRMDSGRR